MPLVQEINISSSAKLFVWEMTESREELLVIAAPEDSYLRSLAEIHHAKRRRELLALKAMLRYIGFDEKITYLPNGKPVVSDKIHISISHCDQYAGFLLSDRPCGLDIQNKNEKIALIARRFCNDEEMKFAFESQDPLALYTAMWSIKESIFKVYGEKLAFAEQMNIKEFEPYQDDKIEVQVTRPEGDSIFQVRKHMIANYFAMMAFLD